MKNFKEVFYYLSGGIYAPKELVESNEKILLHISDTPTVIFRGLSSLIKELKPYYIIHTGDLVDNIKLELYPNRINQYKKELKKLIGILENSNSKKTYIILGNHDDKKAVKNVARRSLIIENSDVITIGGIEFKVSHFPKEILKDPREYNLFGHDLTIDSKIENDKIYLNGISNINVILLDSKRIFTLSYPFGTNDSRMCKMKTGF